MDILVIDDKNWGVRQICDTAQKLNFTSFTLSHFSSIKDFRKVPPFFYTWAFLDFFLDADSTTGDRALPFIQSEYLIGFSSLKKTSDVLVEEALKSKRWDLMKVCGIKKVKHSCSNKDLELFMNEQISSDDIHLRLSPVLHGLKGSRESKIQSLEILGEWRSQMSSLPRPAFMEFIIPLLQDPCDRIRYTAVIALEKLGYHGALVYLKKSETCTGLKEFTLGESREKSVEILKKTIAGAEKKIEAADRELFE